MYSPWVSRRWIHGAVGGANIPLERQSQHVSNRYLRKAYPVPQVNLEYTGTLETERWQWNHDCWLTYDGKAFVPADDQDGLAANLKKFFDCECVPAVPSSPFRKRFWKPRYIRFVHFSLNPEATRTRLVVEVPGYGRGIAGEEFG